MERIDPSVFKVTAKIRVPTTPTALAADPVNHALWIASSESGTLYRLDTRSDRVTKTIHIGYKPVALAVASGHIWLAVDPR